MDVCNDYKVLREDDRAQGNSDQNNVRCDQRDLAPGWYRFQDDAGDKMPDKCVPIRRCGTHAPGWLHGAHPTVAEGVVTREVCYHWSNNCCNWKNNIRVKNCGYYFVYELARTPVCSLRYCGNAGPGNLFLVVQVTSKVCLKNITNFANKVNRQLNPGLNFSHELDRLVTLHVIFHLP